VGLGLVCAVVALPARAAISVQIPAECGSLPAFEQELEQRLGSVSAPEATRITLTPEVSGYQLVVEAGSQRRELHDASCQELLRAAIVVTLALLDPKKEEATLPAAEPEPTSPAPAPESTSTPKASAPNAPSPKRPKFALGANGGLHLGTLPKATLMLELDAQLQWARFGVALGFRYLLPTSTVDEKNRGVRLGAVGAHLAFVFEPWHRVQTRLGVATYRLTATGIGSAEYYDASAWEVAPTLGASVIPFERPPFWTRLGLEGQLNLIQPNFEIRNYDEVFYVPAVSGSALAGAGVVF
jgi:hypothetical protein